VQLPAGVALICEALEPLAGHLFTSRAWRLGDRTADSSDGWLEVARALQVGVNQVRRLRQVHEADAVTYKKGERGPEIPQADIVLTDDPTLAIVVQTADCIPILIVDRRTSSVAAAHAGWRGLAAHVPHVAVEKMAAEFDSRREDLVVAIGPAIGACCYEVGADVRERFAQARFSPAALARWFHPGPLTLPANPPMRSLLPERRQDRWFFDGWTCAREQLESAGVPRAQIFSADLCTGSHEPFFCSYRRDGAVAGRMAAVIRPRPSRR